MPKLSRKRLAVAVAVLVVLSAVISFGPLVRSRVESAAARYGATVEIDWVLPAWGGVRLQGVRVRHPDAPGIRADFDTVRVGWGSPRVVAVEGGKIELAGSPDELLAQVERVRAKLPASSEGGGDGGGTRVTVDGVGVAYAAEGIGVEATGLWIAREEAGWTLGFTSAKSTQKSLTVEAQQGAVTLAREESGWKIAKLSAGGVDASLDLSGGETAAVDAAAAAGGKRARIAVVRRALERVDREVGALLSRSGELRVDGVRATVRRGGETLSVGPASLRLRREADRHVVEYLAGETTAGVPSNGSDGLVVRTRPPQPDEPLVVEVRGGPIGLSALGVRDGDLHLVDTASTSVRVDAKLEIDPGAEVAFFDGSADVTGLGFHHAEIAKDPVRGLRASFRGKVRAALDGSKLTVQNGDVQLGNVRLATSFEVEVDPDPKKGPKPGLKADAKFEVPLVPCQALLDAAPLGMFPTIEGMRLAGSFSLKGSLKFDRANLDRTYALDYDLSSTCRVTDVPPDVAVARFKAPFKLRVYAPGGEKELDLETGPGTANWTSYGSISRFMELAAITCEDGRFHRHEGFDHEAIRNSVRENIRQGRFFRGASTISMQLAKNLYLSRDKRLSRKLEEIFLTMYLEQELTKEQIIELYLNVVEFGPEVYGIGEASRHYFSTSPSRLTVSQAFYLASILPSPRVQHFAAGGAVSPGWLNNLRTLMKYANKVKRLSDEDLEAGLSEIPVRGSPAPMRDPDAKYVPPSDDDPPVLDSPDAP